MIRGLVIMLSLSASMQAFAQGTPVTEQQKAESFEACLVQAAKDIASAVEELTGKSSDSAYRKGQCNEERMSCVVQVRLQYKNEDGSPQKVVLASQEVIFMEQEQGLCSETIVLEEPQISVLKAQ